MQRERERFSDPRLTFAAIHAVDKVHAGQGDSSVLYIPVCPVTAKNADFLARQRACFRAGAPGPDFPGGEGEKRHVGRATEEDFLGEEAGGREAEDAAKAMGLRGMEVRGVEGEGERRVLEEANAILGF